MLIAGLCKRDLEFNTEEKTVTRVTEPNIILNFPSEMSFKHPWLPAFTDGICQGRSITFALLLRCLTNQNHQSQNTLVGADVGTMATTSRPDKSASTACFCSGFSNPKVFQEIRLEKPCL